MNELQKEQTQAAQPAEVPALADRLAIIEEGLRKNYLTRLDEMEIVPSADRLPALEDDLIDNVRLYRITEMVYKKGESVVDKLTTVFNTLSTYRASVFVVMDSDGKKTDFYLGVRNDEPDEKLKRSTVTLGDTLKNALIGHFPGVKIENEDRMHIAALSNKIARQHNAASVSVVGSPKSKAGQNEAYVQGLEKLALAMSGRPYIGILVAENQDAQTIQRLRKNYQDLYTKLSPYQKTQYSDTQSHSSSRRQSFSEMSGRQKAAAIGGAIASLAGMVAGGVVGNAMPQEAVTAMIGMQVGGQAGGQISSFINSLAPTEQYTENASQTASSTVENKAVTDLLHLIDTELRRIDDFESYGMWRVAGYFVSDDMSAAEIAASNYRSLMNGEGSGREVSAINAWRSGDANLSGDFRDLTAYLSRFLHPQFYYGASGDQAVYTDAATAISGKELGLHLELPRAAVPGLPVIEHAEFGKEVISYQLIRKEKSRRPQDRITIGRIFDLGQITDKPVELDNRSLNMHTFITGSTGSGKSNTVYQMLSELHQDNIPFLVIEPAKGEYKDVFGHWNDVRVYATNPKAAPLIHLNPFQFPDSVHVLEHVDGLVEIFSACWPMYDAMPAFFKAAILRAYEKAGWDLGASVFEGPVKTYPDFRMLAETLEALIAETDYSAEVKGNYTGALVTRVKSLTVGLNQFIFADRQTPYAKLFDENCILDISRVKSTETKALLMGLMVYMLNEYRSDTKAENNSGLKHVTVLEEAHNLLKNTSGSESDLVGKSVEMITNTIAEIRTYGEGFIIVDQSPSSVDIAAIKNTNTKIVLRTPEAHDREAVGRSMGLTESQVNEIAKLPSGVAAVYQNDWVDPVLCMVNKAQVEERPYVNPHPAAIKSLRASRSDLIRAVMEPWIPGPVIPAAELNRALKRVEVSQAHRRVLSAMLQTYENHGGHLLVDQNSLWVIRDLLFDLLGLSRKAYQTIMDAGDPDRLRREVIFRTAGLEAQAVEEICYMLTMEETNES
jgi:hypothetical protein